MDNYGPSTYGEAIGDVYDEWFDSPRMDPVPAVDLLAELAGEGAALELGVGTGRLAIPLAARGVPVTGVDASPRMLGKLQEKAGGARVRIIEGNMVDAPIDGGFSLVYVAFSTLYSVLTQEEQIRCLRHAAGAMEDGGHLVIEAFVHDSTWWTQNQAVSAQRVQSHAVSLVAAHHDPVTQRIEQCYVHLSEQGVRILPVPLRYASPPELDVMAMVAGLDLVHRWEDYCGKTFDASSSHHVSVYRKGGGADGGR